MKARNTQNKALAALKIKYNELRKSSVPVQRYTAVQHERNAALLDLDLTKYERDMAEKHIQYESDRAAEAEVEAAVWRTGYWCVSVISLLYIALDIYSEVFL